MSTHSKRRYQVVLRWRDSSNRPESKTVTVWAENARDAALKAEVQLRQGPAETTVTPL